MPAWLCTEERRLRALWPAKGAALAAALPRHTLLAIYRKAVALGLKGHGRPGRPACPVIAGLVERRLSIPRSSTEIAGRLGMSLWSFSMLEHGHRRPRPGILEAWAAELGIAPVSVEAPAPAE